MGARLGMTPRYRNGRSAEALGVGLAQVRNSLRRLSAQADRAREPESRRRLQLAISAVEDARNGRGENAEPSVLVELTREEADETAEELGRHARSVLGDRHRKLVFASVAEKLTNALRASYATNGNGR